MYSLSKSQNKNPISVLPLYKLRLMIKYMGKNLIIQNIQKIKKQKKKVALIQQLKHIELI